jgi:FtsZ-interacting cell division protein ZipA
VSDLQLSLIVLALIAIAGVWLFNIFLDRRRTRVFEQRLKPRPPLRVAEPDAAVVARTPIEAGQRSEPSFGVHAAHLDDDDDLIDAYTDQPVGGAPVAQDDEPAYPPGTLIDDEIHAVVTIEPETLLSGERAWSLLHPFRHAGRQPVLLVGVRGDLQETIRPGQRYEAVLVAVQLANRSGPLNEIEWSEFVASLQHASEQIPASCEIPDMRETTSRARVLDAKCVPLDAQIGINLTTMHNGWSGQHVADLAREHGMILRPDGRFHALDEHGVTLFVLQNGDGGAFRADTLQTQQTSRLTLLLDVPRAPQAQHPFDRLVELANQLAAALDAAIVDDQSHLLTDTALASIGRQIDPVYTKLIEAGMPAGSSRALALFG